MRFSERDRRQERQDQEDLSAGRLSDAVREIEVAAERRTISENGTRLRNLGQNRLRKKRQSVRRRNAKS